MILACVGTLFPLALYASWYWRNRRWLIPLHREADGPCCMNAHVFAWIRHQRHS